MASLGMPGMGFVCRSCRLQHNTLPALSRRLSRPLASTPTIRHALPRAQTRPATSKRAPNTIAGRRGAAHPPSKLPTVERPRPKPSPPSTTSDDEIDAEDIRGTLRGIQAQINTICDAQQSPEDVEVLSILVKSYECARLLVLGYMPPLQPGEENVSAEDEVASTNESLLSDLDEPSSTSTSSSPKTSFEPSSATTTNFLPESYRTRLGETLCESLHTLLKDPKVRISEVALDTYTRVVTELGNPEYLPEIFYLYAHKPQAIPGSSGPIRYRTPSPNSPQRAIPRPVGDAAIAAAAVKRDVALAVAIIDTSVATRAFRRQKFLQKATLPLIAVGSTPVAAYAAADWVARWQNSLDPAMAKTITLMASAAYLGTLTTIGFVALTTWNDHHERVRWSEGTPLRHRWLREEERLYFDRLALAWGFDPPVRRGEESGSTWEHLREECGIRGLVLDKSDLLPGMQ